MSRPLLTAKWPTDTQNMSWLTGDLCWQQQQQMVNWRWHCTSNKQERWKGWPTKLQTGATDFCTNTNATCETCLWYLGPLESQRLSVTLHMKPKISLSIASATNGKYLQYRSRFKQVNISQAEWWWYINRSTSCASARRTATKREAWDRIWGVSQEGDTLGIYALDYRVIGSENCRTHIHESKLGGHSIRVGQVFLHFKLTLRPQCRKSTKETSSHAEFEPMIFNSARNNYQETWP